jgi:hypothetical protein
MPVATPSVVHVMRSLLVFLLTLSLLVTYAFAGTGTLTVSGTQLGVTSQYLGANEGSSQFNINDLVDLGINSYRMYGGMSRWEPTNDSSTYGSPISPAITRCESRRARWLAVELPTKSRAASETLARLSPRIRQGTTTCWLAIAAALR